MKMSLFVVTLSSLVLASTLLFQPALVFAATVADEFVLDDMDAPPWDDGDIILIYEDGEIRMIMQVEYKYDRCVQFSFPIMKLTDTAEIFQWDNNYCRRFRERAESLLDLPLTDRPEVPVCFNVIQLLAKKCSQIKEISADIAERQFQILVAVAEELRNDDRFAEALLVYQRARQCAPDAVFRQDMTDNINQLTVADKGLLDHGIEQAFLKIEEYVWAGRVPQACSSVWIDVYQKKQFLPLEIPLALLRIMEVCSLNTDKQELAELVAIKENWNSIDDVAATFDRFSELSMRQSVRPPVCFTAEEFEQMLEE